MAKKTAQLLPLTTELLNRFGERLRLARLRRNLSAKRVAERAGMSLMTLRSLERGGTGVTIGAYLAVMQVLGLEKDIELLGQADALGRELQDAKLAHLAKSPARANRSTKNSRESSVARLSSGLSSEETRKNLEALPTERVRKVFEAVPSEQLRKSLEALPSEQMLKTLEALPIEQLRKAFEAVPLEQLRKTFESLPTEQVRRTLEALPTEQVRKAFEAVPSELLRKTLEALPTEQIRKTLEALPAEQIRKAFDVLPSSNLGDWIEQSGFTSSEKLAKLLDITPLTPLRKRR